MEDEVNKQIPKEESKPINMVDEARAIRDEIKEQKEAIIKEREDLQRVQSEALLSGTAGGAIEKVEPVEQTPKEYADEVMSGKMSK